MKKNLMKILSLVCAAGFALLGAGCELTDTISGLFKKQEGNGKALMNGFEVFDRDVQLLRVFNRFGRLEQNTDKEYVKSGESSLRVQPFGGRIINNTANPFFIIPTVSTRFSELAFGDFSKVDKVSFWVYNTEDEELNIGVGFQTENIAVIGGRPTMDKVRRTTTTYYTVKSGWNYIEYEVLPAYLTWQGLDLKQVLGIAFEFDYVWSNDFADAPELYIDDVCLSYTDETKPTEVEIPITKTKTSAGLDTWVLCDFETSMQEWYFFSGMLSGPVAAGQPTVKRVFAGDYGALTTEGSQALLVQKHHGAGQRADYIGLFMYPEVMKAAFNAIGEDFQNNPQNYRFAMDIYNGATVADTISVAFVGTNNRNSSSSITTRAGEWNNYSYHSSFDFINEIVRGDSTDTSLNYTVNPSYLRFAWGDYSSTGVYDDRPILIDNLRIEKIA